MELNGEVRFNDSIIGKVIKKPNKLVSQPQNKLAKDIRKLITKSWGDFGEKFVKERILNCYLIFVLKDKKSQLIGLASVSQKRILERNVYYFELTVVDPEYQSRGLAEKMNFILVRRLFLESILKGRFILEFMLITPNMKILAALAKVATFIYPNPYLFNNKTSRIFEADDETWEMAKELIKKSDNPSRTIEREGCILKGSYSATPSLIYGDKHIPKHHDKIVNEFGEKYLRYSRKEDREFIVRAKLSLKSLIAYSLGEKPSGL